MTAEHHPSSQSVERASLAVGMGQERCHQLAVFLVLALRFWVEVLWVGFSAMLTDGCDRSWAISSSSRFTFRGGSRNLSLHASNTSCSCGGASSGSTLASELLPASGCADAPI